MTMRQRRILAMGFGVLFIGSAGTFAAQSNLVTLDNVPKKQLFETIQKAPRDQVFVVRGKRMTKQDIANEAKAVHDQFVAQLPAIRIKMAELHKKSTDWVAQRLAAQKAELDAANAKVRADAQAFLAAK